MCDEIESIQREEEESTVDFDLRLTQHYYRFHDDDQPAEEDYVQLRVSLIRKYFCEDE